MHPKLAIDEFVLIYHESEQELADLTLHDMRSLCPDANIHGYIVNYEKPLGF